MIKYKCGHGGCDICGARTCAGTDLKHLGKYDICPYCLNNAIKLAIHVSESFSTIIDVDKKCAKEQP